MTGGGGAARSIPARAPDLDIPGRSWTILDGGDRGRDGMGWGWMGMDGEGGGANP